MALRLLVVDDEEGIRRVLAQLLEYEGHEVRAAGNAAEALELHREFRPDLTFMDVKMARMDGLEALSRIREADPLALVVMISGHGTIETAVEATAKELGTQIRVTGFARFALGEGVEKDNNDFAAEVAAAAGA